MQDAVGPDGHGGYQHVVHLANALVELRAHGFVTQRQTRNIIALWDKLSERDKAPPRHQDRLVRGQFKTYHIPDSVKR